MKDYYAVLGVQQSASQRAIQKAFRKLAQGCHPDINPSPEAKERFQELIEAYQALKVQDKRDEFDARVISEFCGSYLGSFEKTEKEKKKEKERPKTEFLRLLRK
ncbi:MAG: DnaJ domain-containing protein [Gammaproteobacteria bacterium]|nr:DnaJ domain-containing protein [Gammaproteobacteria bacterium]